MEIEKEQQLIDYLAGLGFTGESLEEDLRENILLGAHRFSIAHKISYGEDTMFFDLRFQLDAQFNEYRLDSYRATYRDAVRIRHQVIDGIDTAELEKKVALYNWDAYFKNLITDATIRDTMTRLIFEVNKLARRDNNDALTIFRELIYKYWPADSYGTDIAKGVENEHQHSRDFLPAASGFMNANLVYFHMSEKLLDIYERLSRSGADNLPGFELHDELERHLATNPDNFILYFSRSGPDGLVEYSFPVTKGNGNYYANDYALTLTPYPAIDHGKFNGVDTGELEKMMREIDWRNNNEIFIFHDNAEIEFRGKVGEIQEKIYALSQDMMGAEIADLLQLKYWSDVTFFGDNIQQNAWDKLEELPKRTGVFSIQVNVVLASNLLHGRAALNMPIDGSFTDDLSYWIRLDLSNKNEKGEYLTVQTSGYSKAEVDNQLSLLPIPTSDYYPVRNSLLRGDLTPVVLNSKVRALLQANPDKKEIDIYTLDLRPIPFNFQFDPDWKPGNVETHLQSKQEQQSPEIKRLNEQIKPAKEAPRNPKRNNKGKSI